MRQGGSHCVEQAAISSGRRCGGSKHGAVDAAWLSRGVPGVGVRRVGGEGVSGAGLEEPVMGAESSRVDAGHLGWVGDCVDVARRRCDTDPIAAFLVTGNPGSGKSTLAQELARRGLATIDPDYDPELSRWEDDAGKWVSRAEEPAAPDEQWLRAHH